MPCCIDLHVHTEYSDGPDSPESILEQAAYKNIQYLSFADHDSLYWLIGKSEMHFANASSKGISLVRGIELSTRDSQSGKRAHLLAYWPGDVPFKFRNVSQIVRETQQMRNNVALKQINILKKMGYVIDYDAVLKLTHDGQIFKNHIALELIHLGYAKKMNESFYKKILDSNEELDIRKDYPETIEVLHAIGEDGGLSVLAHPGENLIQNMIKRLKGEGLRGVECYYPSHSIEYCDEVRKITIENGLFVTSGSDFHGIHYRSGVLGKYNLSDIDFQT